jgi:chromosome segregation ATPase
MLNLRQRDLEQMSRLREQLESVRGNIRQEVRSSDRDLSQLREDIQKMQMELNIVRAELKLLLESIVRRLDTIQPKQ